MSRILRYWYSDHHWNAGPVQMMVWIKYDHSRIGHNFTYLMSQLFVSQLKTCFDVFFQIEERRTVKDSDGNETTTVTKTIGGKSETSTTTTRSSNSDNSSGILSRFFGPDENAESSLSPRDKMLKPIPEHEQPSYRSIFSKLFGKWKEIVLIYLMRAYLFTNFLIYPNFDL